MAANAYLAPVETALRYLQKVLANAFPRVNCLALTIEHMTGKLFNES